ncbi:D-glucuronyl C5-epimerase B [Bacillus rossius redtenbacheri]|uniref:D-glucuronyl C5-epimerase B n=1 Tax=Bacillus rossius redtenbacheri TaxID=93214 RepID=UPI002FDC90D6
MSKWDVYFCARSAFQDQRNFAMVRLNLKIALIAMCVAATIVTLSMWTQCGEVVIAKTRNLPEWGAKKAPNSQDSVDGDVFVRGANDAQGYEEIECHINGEFSIGCRKEGNEIYLPFSFLHKYFEVYGKLATYDGYERFEWSHSYSKVYYPKGKYDPRGVFMYFENYNVEVRDRVKCVSAIEGVPVSTQWESQGYFYPTQIAQFGLSHYSKNLTEPEPRRKLFEDGDRELATWEIPSGATFARVPDPAGGSLVVRYTSPDSLSSGVLVKLDHVLDFVLSLNLQLSGNSSFTVILHGREKREVFQLHYLCSDLLISAQDQHIYHGIGHYTGWRKLTRDLIVDLQKGLAYQNNPKRKLSRSKFKVAAVVFRGAGSLDNLTLSSSEHLDQFYDAARWFVRHQDPGTGGWANPVRRRVAPGMADLEPGWYSAMGQGHAISVLARAYFHSGGERRYLEAALAGLKPFQVPSSRGGVLASFLDRFPWYEEYPTAPASFVLNGFVYSLLGLLDLSSVAPPGKGREEAAALFDRGVASLKRLLPLFDTGSGTTYDLRHLALGTAPNLARWDYHATHVNQLLLLATVDADPLIAATAERWIGYMSGKRAAHN